MRRRFWVFMLCAALLLSGCGAVTFSGVTGKAAKAEDRMEEAAGETGTAEQVTAKIEETASEEAAEAEEAVEKAGTGEMAQEAGEKKPADNEAETKEDEALEEDRSAEKAAEQSSEEKDQKKSEKKKSEKKKDEKKAEEEKASEEKELEPQYIPDGFTPYGNYVLVYDSGFEVKTRYSAAGLTYYWESEEFYFRLNKDLPDMTRGSPTSCLILRHRWIRIIRRERNSPTVIPMSFISILMTDPTTKSTGTALTWKAGCL